MDERERRSSSSSNRRRQGEKNKDEFEVDRRRGPMRGVGQEGEDEEERGEGQRRGLWSIDKELQCEDWDKRKRRRTRAWRRTRTSLRSTDGEVQRGDRDTKQTQSVEKNKDEL